MNISWIFMSAKHIHYLHNNLCESWFSSQFFHLLVLFFRNSSSYLIVPPTQALPLPKEASASHQFFYKPLRATFLWDTVPDGLTDTSTTGSSWPYALHHPLHCKRLIWYVSPPLVNGLSWMVRVTDQPTACQWVWLDDFFLNLWKLVVIIYLFNPSIPFVRILCSISQMCSQTSCIQITPDDH